MGNDCGVRGRLFFLINEQTVPGVAQAGHRNASWTAACVNDQLPPPYWGRRAGCLHSYLQPEAGTRNSCGAGGLPHLPPILFVLFDETRLASLPQSGEKSLPHLTAGKLPAGSCESEVQCLPASLAEVSGVGICSWCAFTLEHRSQAPFLRLEQSSLPSLSS